ncbi:MAG: lysylphosphatidylglycerol synthase domain-containing protein [Pseudomonadota bacterium]
MGIFFLWSGLFIYLKVNYIFKKITFFLPVFIQDFLNQLHQALTIKRAAVDIFGIVIFSLVIWFLYVFQIWFILNNLLLIELTLSQLLIVFIVTALGMAIPSVPGAIGVYEAAMVLSLGWFGIDKVEALAAGLVCHAFVLIPCTIFSFFIFANMKINIHSLKMILLKTVKNETKK